MATESSEPQFPIPGHPDLDSTRLRFFFCAFAGVLSERSLESFEECNELVGSANGIASGAVSLAIDDLSKRGYLQRFSKTGGVTLTAKGDEAARAAGILVD